ncbi:MAG: hypothetical protein WD872_02470 [Pirellulaceae bacterium]
MLSLTNLKVSITKNGYIKIADVVRRHPIDEIIDNTDGSYDGINLIRSQVIGILDAEENGKPAMYWGNIPRYGDEAIDALTFVAIVLSHHHLVDAFINGNQGEFLGKIKRTALSVKEYTNLVYSMAGIGIAPYRKGSAEVRYDMRPVVYHLLRPYKLVRQLFTTKLRKCGWNGSGDLIDACLEQQFNEVFGLTSAEFSKWLNGELNLGRPAGDFGLQHHDLPSTGSRRTRPR